MSLPSSPTESLHFLPPLLRDVLDLSKLVRIIFENSETQKRASLYDGGALTPFIRVDEWQTPDGMIVAKARDACEIIVAPQDPEKFRIWIKDTQEPEVRELGFGLFAVNLYCSSNLNYLVEAPDPLRGFMQHPGLADLTFRYVEHNEFAVLPQTIRRDSFIFNQWPILEASLGGINLRAAHAVTKGDPNVKVAIIDKEIVTTHQEFINAHLIGGTTIPAGAATTADPNSHGTACAAIIFAQGQRLIGVAPQCSLIPINIASVEEKTSSCNLVEAIHFAQQKKANIVSISFEVASDCVHLREAMEKCREILFVNAIGNGGHDLEHVKVYPASYRLPGQISVLGCLKSGSWSAISNYDRTRTVGHLCAPGEDICCSVGNTNGYENKDGTSLATPYVAGVCALVWSIMLDPTPAKVRKRVFDSVFCLPAFHDISVTGGRLDAGQAVTGQVTNCYPAPPHP